MGYTRAFLHSLLQLPFHSLSPQPLTTAPLHSPLHSPLPQLSARHAELPRVHRHVALGQLGPHTAAGPVPLDSTHRAPEATWRLLCAAGSGGAVSAASSGGQVPCDGGSFAIEPFTQASSCI